MRDALEEERRGAIIERIGCELELGRHADLVGELRHLLARYPLDEMLVAHQMTALYRNGRQADALSLYRETRGRLIDEQGAEPGAMLAELQQRILAGDAALNRRPTARPAVQAAPSDTSAGDTPDFVGRDAELELLTGEHDHGPWVAVIEGMPGVGKTTLAARAARAVAGQYPDGTFYLNLHSHDPQARRSTRPKRSPPAPDAVRAGRADTEPAAARATLWRAHLSRRRRSSSLMTSREPTRFVAAPVVWPQHGPDHHPAAARCRRRAHADPRRAVGR